MEERVIFQVRLEALLKDKPHRYRDIIKAHIERHQEYMDKINLGRISIESVISYMVQLDKEYVSVRGDNE